MSPGYKIFRVHPGIPLGSISSRSFGRPVPAASDSSNPTGGHVQNHFWPVRTMAILSYPSKCTCALFGGFAPYTKVGVSVRSVSCRPGSPNCCKARSRWRDFLTIASVAACSHSRTGLFCAFPGSVPNCRYHRLLSSQKPIQVTDCPLYPEGVIRVVIDLT
jgi:hypothetical protein